MAISKLLTQTAKAMIAAKSVAAAVGELRRRCPELYRHIRTVTPASPAVRLWGRSLNFDEIAKQTIVDPRILAVIEELTGVPMPGEIVHAGLEHTYGYLFSLIETPFGLKRDRWIKEELDRAFGFSRPILDELPSEGTLLFNITYFIGRIAFRGEPRKLALLRKIRDQSAREVVEFNYRRLKVARLTETVAVPKSSKHRISLFTDLVRFPDSDRTSDRANRDGALLVYSLADSRQPLRQLVTTFPVSVESMDEIVNPAALGKNQPVRPRFNASVESLPREGASGKRFIADVWWPTESQHDRSTI